MLGIATLLRKPTARPTAAHATILLGIVLGGCAALAGPAASIESAAVPALADGELQELSGLAPATQARRYWGHNDYGNESRLFRLDADGGAHGRVAIAGADNRDWEDLAWRDTADGRCLLIAEIGDNRAQHAQSMIHFLVEPPPDADKARTSGSQRFRYPQGARDAEGLAFDPREGAIYVLSKRSTPPQLYRLPAASGCAPASDAVVVADPVAELLLPAPPLATLFESPRRGLLFNLPTGLAISRDGARMAVLSYGAVFVFDRAAGESWAAALQRVPGRVIFPRMAQAEAIALDATGRAALIGSEGDPGRVQRVELPAFDDARRQRPERKELGLISGDQVP